ncbi:MAG: AI-2E family transporter [Myxococcota bacterium]
MSTGTSEAPPTPKEKGNETDSPQESGQAGTSSADADLVDVNHSPGAITFFLIVFVAAFFAFFALFWAYVTDFVLAFMFTALFRNAYERLRERLGDKPVVASALITCFIAVLVALPLGFIITSLSVEVAAFYNSTISTLTLERLQGFLFGEGPQAVALKHLAELAGLEWTPALVKDALTRVSGTVAETLYTLVSNQLSNVFALAFHFLIMLVIIFYMLVDGKRLKAYAFETSPLPDDEEELLAQKFASVGRATLFGNGFGSVVQGFIGAVSMVVVGLPSPVLWGVVMTIFAFLPLVGVSVVTVPAAIYLALTGHWLTALLFFGFNFAQALFVENVVKTRMIGQQMKMHSLLIFLSIIGGIGIFGVIGLLYGPLIVALFLTLAELYHQRYKAHILDSASLGVHSHAALPSTVPAIDARFEPGRESPENSTPDS